MKILSVRLCPFGAVADQEFHVTDGLQVFVGPNEAGKSTLCEAVLHGLFTSVALTPKAREKAVGRWYPRNGGDHAKVIVKFRVDGDDWTLEKQWAQKDRGCQCSLRGPVQLVDAGRVDEKLAELVGAGKAVWERVLVTSQSELNSTIARLRDTKVTDGRDALDAVRQASRGLRMATDDVLPEAFGRIIDMKIEEAWSNWDRSSNGPRDGKGIGHPWQQRVGHVLKAYYDVERLRKAITDAGRWERQDERLRSELHGYETKYRDLSQWRLNHESIRDQIIKSQSRVSNVTTCEQNVNGLAGEVQRWKQREGEQSELQRDLRTLEADDARLQVEQSRMVVKCTEALRAVRASRDSIKAPAPEQLEHAKSIERQLSIDRAQLDASTCRVRIEVSGEPQDVLFVEGLSEPERLRCEGGALLERGARAGFRIETSSLKVTAELGKVDLDSLRSSVASRQRELDELLSQWKVTSVEEATDLRAQNVRLNQEIERLEKEIKTLLDGKTAEEWSEIAKGSVSVIAEPRDIAAVRNAVHGNKITRTEKEATLRFVQEDLSSLMALHGDLAALEGKCRQAEVALEAALRNSPALPVPMGFPTVQAFLGYWDEQPGKIMELEETLGNKRAELERHARDEPQRSEDELAEDLGVAERELQLARDAGNSWLRIQAAYRTVVAAQDPLAATSKSVDNYLRAITLDRYSTQQVMDGVVCTVAGGPAGDMSVDMLSYGTGDALALATRLGLAQAVIPEGEGVLMLDDPLTEMDRERQACAARTIVEFARTRQVVLFTCREEHAQLLDGEHVRVTRLESRL